MSDSLDKVKFGMKLGASAGFSFLKINLIGIIVTFLFFITSSFFLVKQSLGNGGGPAHSGGFVFLLVIFVARPISSFLVLLLSVLSPLLNFQFGNKYIISKTIHKIISEKGEFILFPLVEKIIYKLKEHQPEFFKQGVDKAKLKLKLIQEIKNSTENFWIKQIINYGLTKISFDEIDFTKENFSFTEIINQKLVQKISEISEPSRKFFFIILGLQLVLFLLVYFQVI